MLTAGNEAIWLVERPSLPAMRQPGKGAHVHTIAILSQKGGTGKTTLTLHLAVASERAGMSAAVIDLDPQASAAGWKDSRPGETPVVVSIPSSRLPQAVQAARTGGAALALIDTAPHATDAALAA